MKPDPRPLLVFFGAAHSGPARRMESLVAHLARKERTRLRVTQVDIDEQPELAERFRVETVPTIAPSAPPTPPATASCQPPIA